MDHQVVWLTVLKKLKLGNRAGDERPDGIFCYNDPVAMGSMRAILEAGLKIPEDIAVVGCGNLFYADLLRVPLTSIDHQGERSMRTFDCARHGPHGGACCGPADSERSPA
jgi:hypothetical protein